MLDIWRITLIVMLRVGAFICMLPAYVNRQISAYCFMPVLLDGLKQEVAWNNSRPSRCLPCILLYFREHTRWEQIWEIKTNVLHAWKQTLRYLPTYPLYAEWHTRLPQGSAARKTVPAGSGRGGRSRRRSRAAVGGAAVRGPAVQRAPHSSIQLFSSLSLQPSSMLSWVDTVEMRRRERSLL